MAKKIREVRLEDIELKPQVIGHTYKKRSNLGRVLFVIAIFVFCVLNIDQISVYINELLGRPTADSIVDAANGNENKKDTVKEIEYKEITDDLEYKIDSVLFNEFSKSGNNIGLKITNLGTSEVVFNTSNYYLNTYSSDKSLLDTYKLYDLTLKSTEYSSYYINVKDDFKYINLEKKSADDYNELTLNNNKLACVKGNEKLNYTFVNNLLTNIEHNIKVTDTHDGTYNSTMEDYKTIVNDYNKLDGYKAELTEDNDLFNVSINVNLSITKKIDNKYYFKNQELAKIVKYDMQLYDFVCN